MYHSCNSTQCSIAIALRGFVAERLQAVMAVCSNSTYVIGKSCSACLPGNYVDTPVSKVFTQ